MCLLATIRETRRIFIKLYGHGYNDAGFIRRLTNAPDKKTHSTYELKMNRNHTVAMSFVTLAHELAHLFLGHLGEEKKLHL